MSDIKEEPIMVATDFLVIKDSITGNIISQTTGGSNGTNK